MRISSKAWPRWRRPFRSACSAPGPHSPRSAPSASGYQATTVLSGQSLSHAFTTAACQSGHERLTLPDDITVLRGILYVGFQNGVGPQGQASTDGNRDSTVVAFTSRGKRVGQWDLRGKCDGLTADPGPARSSRR